MPPQIRIPVMVGAIDMGRWPNHRTIPDLDPTAIPGHAWLFHTLLVFSFCLHVLFLNLTLGGRVLAAVARMSGAAAHIRVNDREKNGLVPDVASLIRATPAAV